MWGSSPSYGNRYLSSEQQSNARKIQKAEEDLQLALLKEQKLQQEILIAQSTAIKRELHQQEYRRSIEEADQQRQRELLLAERQRIDYLQKQRFEEDVQQTNLALYAERERSRIRLAERAAAVDDSRVFTENRVQLMKARSQYVDIPPEQRNMHCSSSASPFYYSGAYEMPQGSRMDIGREQNGDYRSLDEIKMSNAAMRRTLGLSDEEELN
jgi:hypothetical protein